MSAATPPLERCAACDAPLAEDQRFCLTCGERCAADELHLGSAGIPSGVVLADSRTKYATSAASLPAGRRHLPSMLVTLRRRPLVRSAAATAIVVLTLGIAIGATIGPATVGRSAAAQGPLLVVSAPAAAPAAGGAAGSADAVDTSSGDSSSPPDEAAALPDAASSSSSAVDVPTESVPAATPTPGDQPADDGATDQPADTPPPGSTQLAGTVLAADADRFVLSDRDGALLEVHASGCGVQPGDDLHLRARQLANGTWSADRVRVVPRPAERLAVIGTVTWVDPAGGRYALGARGVTLLVTLPQPVAGTPAPPPVPAVGEHVQVAFEPPVAGQPGDAPAPLVERSRMALPADPSASVPPPPLELRGRVAAVDPQARTLALALDSADPATTVPLTIPPAIQPSTVLPAQDVAVTSTWTAQAGYALTGVSADGDASAADDASTFQGDQASADLNGEAGTTVTTCRLLLRSQTVS